MRKDDKEKSKEIKRQLRVMKRMVKPDAMIHDAFVEMTNLINMFFYYLEGKYSKESEND